MRKTVIRNGYTFVYCLSTR